MPVSDFQRAYAMFKPRKALVIDSQIGAVRVRLQDGTEPLTWYPSLEQDTPVGDAGVLLQVNSEEYCFVPDNLPLAKTPDIYQLRQRMDQVITDDIPNAVGPAVEEKVGLLLPDEVATQIGGALGPAVSSEVAAQVPPAVASEVAASVPVAVDGAIESSPAVLALTGGVSAVTTRMDDVEPAALSAKDRQFDISEYVDTTGTTDSTAGFLQAFADANGRTMFLRDGVTVLLNADAFAVADASKNKFSLIGGGTVASRIKIVGSGTGIKFDATPTPTSSTRRQWWRLENLYIEGPGKAVAGSIGLHINNALLGHLSNVTVTGFETGVLVDAHGLANGAANYYNDFFHLIATNCGTALKVTGQANTQRFFGGSFRLSNVGVHIEGSNNVVLFGGDIEANAQYGVIMDAWQNHLIGVRLENPSATWEIDFRDSTAGGERGRKNTIMTYHTSVNPYGRFGGGALVGQNYIPTGFGYHEMGDISTVSIPYGMHLSRSVSGDNKPLILLEDTFSSSGSPIALQYKISRLSSRLAVMQNTAGSDRIVIGMESNGRPYIEMTHGAAGGVKSSMRWHPGDPNSVITGNIGDLVMRTGTGGGLYVKETGDGTNTGWVKK